MRRAASRAKPVRARRTSRSTSRTVAGGIPVTDGAQASAQGYEGERRNRGTLRRTGHELTPGELARETFSSGAAVTKRLKQLTERGLVERRGDDRDRRVAHVRLTDTGRDLVDGILPEQLSYETAVLPGLDDDGQRELAALLGELLVQLEGRLGASRA
ncbi:hypothetical protein GCM10022206_90060 [Streptomyces chiangmaiensis]